MDADDTVESLDYELNDEDEEGSTGTRRMSKPKSKAWVHKEKLQRFQEKDPEFFQFLKEHDQELLQFDDEDIEDEKRSGASPLSQYVVTLRQWAQQHSDALMQSSVLVGEMSSVFGEQMSDSDGEDDAINEQGAAVFSSSWLPGSDSKVKPPKVEEDGKKKKKKRNAEQLKGLASDEDVVEGFVLSSNEDEEMRDSPFSEKNSDGDTELPAKQKTKKPKASIKRSKKNAESQGKSSKKRKKVT